MTDQAHPDVQTSQEEEAEASPFADLRFGELVDNMYALRTEKEELMAAAKKLAESIKLMEVEVMARMDKEGTTMTRGKNAQVILTESDVPQVSDWDEFYEYVLENEAMHLLQRRIAVPAARETIESGDEIAGVSIFTVRQISLRKNT